MSNRVRALDEAARTWARMFVALADELRNARLMLGLTQAEVAGALGVSRSQICRIEQRRVKNLALNDLIRHAAALGLKPSVKLYPIGGALRDAAQAKYIAKFVERIGHAWAVRLDVPLPLPGDLRAVDIVLHGVCTIAIEVVTRLVDVQALLRASQIKQREIGATRLVIVVAGTHANRNALLDARATLLATFELDSQRTLASLAAGRDPGRDAIVVLA